jgi:sugar (pentulose or hexulose) kinase
LPLAAAFAAVAAEIYRTIPEALDAMVQSDRVITPVAATVAIYAKKYPRA